MPKSSMYYRLKAETLIATCKATNGKLVAAIESQIPHTTSLALVVEVSTLYHC